MTERFPQHFLDELKQRTSLVRIIHSYVQTRQRGRESVALCPFHAEKSPSFTIIERKGFYHCFGCGAHGGAIEFLRAYLGLTFREAVTELAARAGLTLPGETEIQLLPGHKKRPLAPVVARPTAAEEAAEEEAKVDWSRDVFAAAGPAAGTLVEVYLRRRGINIPPPLSLRFAPLLKHTDTGLSFPAMVGAFKDADGRITGIHRTYLLADGTDKARVEKPKKMGGVCWGGAIRLAPAGKRLAVGEGIETSLSVMQEVPGLAVWCAGSLGNIAGRGEANGVRRPHPSRPDKVLPTEAPDLRGAGIRLPPSVEELIILADADGDRPTQAALVERATRRFQAQGITVRVAWPRLGGDFNDMARSPMTRGAA